MWDTLTQGGVLMIPLAASSVLALWVIIDRAWHLRRRRIVTPEIVAAIDTLVDRDDAERARAICERHPGPFASIVREVLDHSHLSRAELRERIEDRGRQEVVELERGLILLETVAAIAPLLGLLGTVFGMIDVFEVVSRQGAGQAQSLAGGIAEALITTAAGLSIGIPALVAYNTFAGKAERLVLEIEEHTNRLVRRVQRIERRSSGAGAGAGAGGDHRGAALSDDAA